MLSRHELSSTEQLLQWLDLSFNKIASLDGEALGELPNLAILNLHVNKLSTFGSVAGLAKLARLGEMHRSLVEVSDESVRREREAFGSGR